MHWAALGYHFSKHAATGFSPYEILHGAEPTFPAAVKEMFGEEIDMACDEEQWDADKMAKEVFKRSVAVKERMVAAGHNLRIAQHRDTLRYARRRDGTYFRRLRKFRAGDYVYVSRPAATGLEPKVKRVILRVVVEKIDGTFLLQGKCGGQLIEHPDNMAPCHLEGLDGRTDSTLSSKRWAYYFYFIKFI